MYGFLTRRAQKLAKWLVLLGIILVARPCRAGPAPIILVQPLSLSVLNLDVATFTVVASSGTTMTYQWYKNGNGNPIPGAASATYTILSVTPADQGRYYVKVSNAYGTVQSSSATLSVLSAPSITEQPVSQIATQGQTASFSVKATGNPSPSYQWFFNGVPLQDAKGSTLNLPSVDWSNSGTYTVVVSNAYGSVTSAPVTLTVVGNLAVNLTTVATPILGSTGFTFQFSVPPGFTYVVMASPDLVNWEPIATNVAQANIELFTDPAASNFPRRFYRIGLQ
jgi:hypothetical protein